MLDTLEELNRYVRTLPLDTDFLPQRKLDLAERKSTSLYPWRGQFSPGLASLLLGAYSDEDTVVLDPFVGSGTTLFEAARMGRKCYGTEVSHAAVQLARMVSFVNLERQERTRLLDRAEKLFEQYLGAFLPMDLFRQNGQGADNVAPAAVEHLLDAIKDDKLLNNFVVTTVMLAMGDKDSLEASSLQNAISRNRWTVMKIPTSLKVCDVAARDARSLPLPDSSIDLIVTSPPYINVFNYHQNYRKAMELMGWRPLKAAGSELGANRKHRGNRFMTVVQYCMDLAQVFAELKRVLRPDGTAVFVVGRESRVRDIAFRNGCLLASTAIGEGSFRIRRWQERRFVNRFGEMIYEDIISLTPDSRRYAMPSVSFGRYVGTDALVRALDSADGEVRRDIEQAIQRAEGIQPSPLYDAST